MISSSDNYLYEKSLLQQRDRTPFSKKSLIYANDTNGGQYDNEVNFDLSAFANSNDFLSVSEASLQIPVVITASALDASNGPSSLDNFVGFKNGSWNIIGSLSCSYDNKEVIQPNNFQNTFVNYRVMSSWSQDDLRNHGATCLFSPDSHNSWLYNDIDVTNSQTTVSRLVHGTGICNNQIVPSGGLLSNTPKTAYNRDVYGNTGLAQRVSFINKKPGASALDGTVVSSQQNLQAVRDEQDFRSELKNYTSVTNASAVMFRQVWYVLCDIPLRHYSSFFENMPLVKGAFLKMNIRLNVGSLVVNTGDVQTAPNTPAMYMKASENTFQYTCPVMVSERDTATMGSSKFCLSVGVVRPPATSFTGFTSHNALGVVSHPLTSCRITIPTVQMKSDDAVKYLESSLAKRVEWADVFQTEVKYVPAGGNFSSMILNGSKNVLGVLIVPQISDKVNGLVSNSTNTTAHICARSPFSTEPATPSPLSITQLQVLYGSENIISPFISYTYEEFLYQVQEVLKINGNQSTGLSSGLISLAQWEDLYRYYWVSLYRGSESDSELAKSITISGINNCDLEANYLVYIVSKKSMVVNCATGKIVNESN